MCAYCGKWFIPRATGQETEEELITIKQLQFIQRLAREHRDIEAELESTWRCKNLKRFKNEPHNWMYALTKKQAGYCISAFSGQVKPKD